MKELTDLKSTISIVIPVYRNEGSLNQTYDQVNELFNSSLSGYALEIIFVNDGSDDGSIEILRSLYKLDQRVRIINFSRNFGQIPAVSAGFMHAKGDLITTISADLQDPVSLIASMTQKCRDGSDVAICYRIRRNDDLLSKFFSKVAYSILKMSVPNMPSGGFDYVMLKRHALDVINSFGSKTRFFQSDILWCGFSVTMIPYERKKREHGRSQYTFFKKFKVFLDAILDISYIPIRAISCTGILISMLGFIYSFIVVLAWAENKTPFSGYAPIIISVLVVGGLNLLMLGIVGEYIWRTYEEVRKKPRYIISEILD